MHSPCSVAHSYHFLCEFISSEEKQTFDRKSWLLLSDTPALSITSNPFDNVVCPDGHVTHTLFACDSQTSCWADQHHVQVDLSGLPDKESCPAPLKPLPPYFSCQRHLQVVAYTVVCDHRQDCADGSDEDFCVFPACQPGTETMCNNKQVSIEHSLGMLVIYFRNWICFGDCLLLFLYSCGYETKHSELNN